jgi:hypothetical protein
VLGDFLVFASLRPGWQVFLDLSALADLAVEISEHLQCLG